MQLEMQELKKQMKKDIHPENKMTNDSTSSIAALKAEIKRLESTILSMKDQDSASNALNEVLSSDVTQQPISARSSISLDESYAELKIPHSSVPLKVNLILNIFSIIFITYFSSHLNGRNCLQNALLILFGQIFRKKPIWVMSRHILIS